jgi:predicted nuclease of restriction endonuclease-like RecB superfamily
MFKTSKYKAIKTVIDGVKFDSKGEAEYYLHLIATGVNVLQLQPKIYLTDARILYKPDFLIKENGVLIYVDYKGMETPVFKIKKRLWKKYIDAPLRIVKKSGKNFKIVEEING